MFVDFQIYNNKNKLVNITADVGEDGRLYRCGQLIFCNCDKDNPEPYRYDGYEVYCSKCGRKSVNTVESEGSNVHLDFVGLDENTMQKLYRLSDTLSHDVWLSISKYFIKLSADDVDFNTPVSHVGWVTSNPKAVEDKLNILDEWKVENRIGDNSIIQENKIKSNVLSNEDKIRISDIVDKLYEVFSVVEIPYGKYNLNDGLCVQNPLNPINDYGRGECWIILNDDNSIWYVRNNSRVGDKLECNNVLIDGELLAIGRCIDYDRNVEKLIFDLKKIMED